ncbi:MAG: ankyrin repeat domain-containing protein, partial [Sulfuricurvum sp.]|nr:ankyrin repeat domain-containing protein [Sulfuricurvum sp.]
NDRITPLHQAAFSGNEHVVDFLLKAKADPHLKNNDGATPYDFAIAKKNLLIAQMIKMNM